MLQTVDEFKSTIRRKYLFQSPYGGIGASDAKIHVNIVTFTEFQSPCGGRGRSDRKLSNPIMTAFTGFNHLTVA